MPLTEVTFNSRNQVLLLNVDASLEQNLETILLSAMLPLDCRSSPLNEPKEAYRNFQVLKKPRLESECHVEKRRSRKLKMGRIFQSPGRRPSRARCPGHMGNNIVGLTHMCRPSPFLRQSLGASSWQSSCFLESLIVFAFSKSRKTSFIGQGRLICHYSIMRCSGAGVGEYRQKLT